MGQLADEVWRLIERRLSFKNEEAREIANEAWHDHAAPLLDELESRQRFMASRGYQPCDIPACNCNSWHGGLAEERLREWGELLGSRTQGETLLSATSKILDDLEAADKKIRRLSALKIDLEKQLYESGGDFDGWMRAMERLARTAVERDALKGKLVAAEGALKAADDIALHALAGSARDTIVAFAIRYDTARAKMKDA